MTTTYEAWLDGRPVYNRLPKINGGYDAPVNDWLASFPDELLAALKNDVVDNGDNYVDPLLCPEDWLDLLAVLLGWHRVWDSTWPVESKRKLLAASNTEIWPFYGTRAALSFVFTALGVRHLIRDGQSFVIGQSAVGDALGQAFWEYEVVLPVGYENTDLEFLARRIDRFFGPLWCDRVFIFDDSPFPDIRLLEFEPNVLFQVGGPQDVLQL